MHAKTSCCQCSFFGMLCVSFAFGNSSFWLLLLMLLLVLPPPTRCFSLLYVLSIKATSVHRCLHQPVYKQNNMMLLTKMCRQAHQREYRCSACLGLCKRKSPHHRKIRNHTCDTNTIVFPHERNNRKTRGQQLLRKLKAAHFSAPKPWSLAHELSSLNLPTAGARVAPTMDMGGCQNYGPFLDPYYNTAPNI